MKVIRKIKDLRQEIKRTNKKSIGFVPTMGALHTGHMSLAEQSVKDNDLTICSIFINPLQFSANEDLDCYPQNFETDKNKLEKAGVDILFFPRVEEIYPPNYQTTVNVKNLSNKLCGISRPDHFEGVCTIVLKLFNIVSPTRAYFGKKDAQQFIILKKMAQDLNLDIEVIGMPLIRDEDGLALSSRNQYLKEDERKEALRLNQALIECKDKIKNGEKDCLRIKKYIKNQLSQSKLITIDYIHTVNGKTLENIDIIQEESTLIAVAIKIGETRLIDNLIIGDI